MGQTVNRQRYFETCQCYTDDGEPKTTSAYVSASYRPLEHGNEQTARLWNAVLLFNPEFAICVIWILDMYISRIDFVNKSNQEFSSWYHELNSWYHEN